MSVQRPAEHENADHEPEHCVIRCRACGRPLTNALSRWAQVGPTCAAVMVANLGHEADR